MSETARQRGDVAMQESRFADASAAYVDAYTASQDPALLLAIGDANQKLGNCDVAVGYYRRYLGHVELTPDNVSIVDERIAVCRGTPGSTDPAQKKESEPPPRASKGWMLGFQTGLGAGGYGGTKVCDCDSQQASTVAFHAHVAKLQSPQLAWIGSTGRDNLNLGSGPSSQDLGHITIEFGARAWLNRRWWLEGTGGIAFATAPGAGERPTYACGTGGSGEDDTSTRYCVERFQRTGLGLSGGAGFEVLSFRSLALSATGRVATGIYSDLRLVIVTAGVSADVFF